MNYGAERSVVLLVGASGTGKTTFALRYLTAGEFVCRFAFDWDGQIAARTRVPGAHCLTDCERALETGWVLYDPNREHPGRHADAFAWFACWVFDACARGPGRKVLLVDEVWRYSNNWQIPQPLAACIQTGRVRELDLVFATQRPNKLNEGITGEATELVCFRTGGARALKVLSDLGADPDVVQALPNGAWVSCDLLNGGEVRGKCW